MNTPSRNESNSLSASYNNETELQRQKRTERLAAKLRQTFNVTGRRRQGSRDRTDSMPDLTHLDSQTQELILRAVDMIKKEDSESVMSTLDESRDLLRNSFEEFKREQEEYRQQLEEIAKLREAATGRQKENAIPLSLFLRQKRDGDGLSDLRPNSGMNSTYQAYFEALLTTDQNSQQHPSDKAAVIKYIRRRERQKRAAEIKKNHQLSDDILEKQTAELMGKIEGMDIKLENERQRQNEILRARVNEKKIKTNNILQANEIIGQANEADLARQRVEQTHREKIEARLSAVRRQQNRTPSNMIHVQSHLNENDDEDLDDEQVEANKKSLQLLNDHTGYQQQRSTIPVYGDDDPNNKVAAVHI